MFTPPKPPLPDGPQVPLPPMPAHAPAPVTLTKVPDGAPAPQVPLSALRQARARMQRGSSSLWQSGKARVFLADIDDETLHGEVLRTRREHAAKERRELAASHREIRGRLRTEALAGRPGRAADLGTALATLSSIPPAPVLDEDVTDRDVARHKRTKIAGNCAIVAALAYGGITVLPTHPFLLIGAAAAAVAAAWRAGRERSDEEQSDEESDDDGGPRPMTTMTIEAPPAAHTPTAGNASLVLSTDDIPEGADRTPYPITRARTAREAADCLLRALQAERLPVGDISAVVQHPWGWQMTVRVTSGTPAAIITAAGDLETALDLPTGGFVPQPMVERRACAIVRLVMSDPFVQAPPMPYRAPKSMSIRDKGRLGASIGGDPLEFSVAGVMGVVVAASGGGKTGLLQAIGEMTTACRDCITIDLDPHGDGLEDLHNAVRLTGRSHDQIEAALLFLLMLSKARARLRGTLGMGKKWEPSPEHPAVFVIIDEYPKLSKLGKKLAFELLLVGRKEGVWVILAAQGGTTLYLGENIAPMLALKAVGPCKVGDTRAVFGDGSVGEGWLPHRLSPATDTDPKDAGHVYLQGMPGRPDEPIEYKVHEASAVVLRKLGAERADAGLLEPDAVSLAAMAGVDLPDFVEPVFDVEGNLKKEAPVELLTWERLLRLCDAEPPALALISAESKATAAAVMDSLTVMDQARVDRIRTERLVEALREYSPEVYDGLTPDALRTLLREGGAGSPAPLGAMDDLLNPRGYKREALEGAA